MTKRDAIFNSYVARFQEYGLSDKIFNRKFLENFVRQSAFVKSTPITVKKPSFFAT